MKNIKEEQEYWTLALYIIELNLIKFSNIIHQRNLQPQNMQWRFSCNQTMSTKDPLKHYSQTNTKEDNHLYNIDDVRVKEDIILSNFLSITLHVNYKQVIDCNLQNGGQNTMHFSFASREKMSLVAIVYLDLYKFFNRLTAYRAFIWL